MGDILKEAIADAKAVRETALENAKMALEEAFTPQIKSMLSAKLKEDDMDDDEVEEFGHDDEAEEGEHTEEGEHEDEAEEGEHDAEEGRYEGEETEEGEHDAEEGEHDTEEGHEDDEEVEESNLDLEAIIRELESELTEDEDEDEDAEEGRGVKESETVEESDEIEEEYEIDEAALTEEDDDEDDKDEVDEELDKSSDIGKGDNNRGSTDVSSAIGGGKKGMTESSAIEAELKEYKEAVHFLKDKLHEVNILNAKLLFTNKLFKSYSLDNNQKLKVVETFDRAQTTREIKLVYSTLAEQFGDNNSIVTKKSIKESASTAVSSTKPSLESRKVISEEVEVANRFKKLAGLL